MSLSSHLGSIEQLTHFLVARVVILHFGEADPTPLGDVGVRRRSVFVSQFAVPHVEDLTGLAPARVDFDWIMESYMCVDYGVISHYTHVANIVSYCAEHKARTSRLAWQWLTHAQPFVLDDEIQQVLRSSDREHVAPPLRCSVRWGHPRSRVALRRRWLRVIL